MILLCIAAVYLTFLLCMSGISVTSTVWVLYYDIIVYCSCVSDVPAVYEWYIRHLYGLGVVL